VPEEETVSARQMRETIRMLDIYDEGEREPLSQKFQTLKPQKKGLGVSANTPSSSVASSTSGQAETEAVGTEEAFVVAKQTPLSVELLSVSSSLSPPCLKPAATRPSPVAKKGKGKAKRKNRRGGKAAEGMDGAVKVEKLVDHD
jgi:hypothetical protein